MEAHVDNAGKSPDTGAGRRDHLSVLLWLLQAGPIIILVTLVVAFGLLAPHFISVRNLQNLLAQSAIVCALGLGQFLVILVRGVDVSVGSVIALSVVTVATLTGVDQPSSIALLIYPLVGLIVGLINGFLIVKGGIPQPLVVTVAMLGIVAGVALLISGGNTLVGVSPAVHWLANGKVLGLPAGALMVLVLAGLFWLMLRRTQWGRWLYAVGGNPDVAQWVGLPRDRLIMSAYAICGATAGIAGMLYHGRTGSASPLSGIGYELDAITAVVVGGASLFGGRGSITNVLFGALIIATIRSGLQQLDVSPFWSSVAIGIGILLALELDVLRKHIETRLRTLRARQVSQ
ncbi:ABC transporter permease [Mesorhizobium sp. M7A.F.Ca.US.010.02.1.1]|uniref:ABC transporter permease n=1 Tax=Mesorhizobium sp. M7A.F.Ca.US.010.02.1.1 TaxID=2496743 RepID=UPI000FD4A66D|nr:ABC transporter permease [Mesorhizobium sp. M7A.F.Ca.US.010.02.1.1]RUW89667.1 ABC transporter permease [Mesorhizobium sp. M7A.F.Ca.US.010.02.1.1]